jgi:hypothetical protein
VNYRRVRKISKYPVSTSLISADRPQIKILTGQSAIKTAPSKYETGGGEPCLLSKPRTFQQQAWTRVHPRMRAAQPLILSLPSLCRKGTPKPILVFAAILFKRSSSNRVIPLRCKQQQLDSCSWSRPDLAKPIRWSFCYLLSFLISIFIF